MIGQRPAITVRDVETLRADPTPERRSEIAGKVAAALDAALTERERALVDEIVRGFVRDQIETVRQAVARAVAASPYLPADVARSLAQDVEEVALPVLQYSPVLAEADLIAVLRDASPAKAEAIAGRAALSSAVSDAVVETGHVGAIARLIGNANADISEASLTRAVERHAAVAEIGKALVQRPHLPPAVRGAIERAAQAHVGTFLRRYLNLPEEVIAEGLHDARSAAAAPEPAAEGEPPPERLPTVVPPGETGAGYARRLAQFRAIEDEMVLHALCTGELAFAETALALRAGISQESARLRLYSEDAEMRRDLLRRADISDEDALVFAAVLSIGNIADALVYQAAAVEAAKRAAAGRSTLWRRMAERIGRQP
ncbi:MAG: DUF2336 domain-containing protein [Alphaproteobacteria bacterium]|nr:DUF2336 domain-containing protein [Alphaproteobacteria bacterium]